jgi:histidyl-tRNA synthetase
MNIQTLKGFRDFLPKEARKRQFVIETLKKVFESYGFEPLETPSLEYEEILMGQYGEEGDKLMYKFEDNGGRKVALRYDQTVPLARIAAQYQNDLPTPLKRYQIQNVWRSENTQKGRYREFLQIDIDTVGVYSPLADAEIIDLAMTAVFKLGFSNATMYINDRKIFENLENKYISAIDKLEKIGREKVLEELVKKGLRKEDAESTLSKVENAKMPGALDEIFKVLKKTDKDEFEIKFKPTLARGLDYYTDSIFELVVEGLNLGSIGGGGRYDNLIGIFAGRDIPAVGFAFGFDRLIEAMDELDLFPKDLNKNNVFVAFANSDLQEKALEITEKLRSEKINAEYYLEDASLEKQLKYADKKQIPFSIVVSDSELGFKDMQKRTQENLTFEQIVKKLKN